MEGFAAALASALGVSGAGAPSLDSDQAKFAAAVAKDLQAHKGASVVIAGDHLPPAVHALVYGLNQALGNVGRTLVYTDAVDANPVNRAESIRDLVADMHAGKVDLLFILGGNPAYDAPADLGFADALMKANIPTRVHLGLYNDETGQLCHWHINEAHYLEAGRYTGL